MLALIEPAKFFAWIKQFKNLELCQCCPLCWKQFGYQLEPTITHGFDNIRNPHRIWIDALGRLNSHRDSLEGIIMANQERVCSGSGCSRQKWRNPTRVLFVVCRSAVHTGKEIQI